MTLDEVIDRLKFLKLQHGGAVECFMDVGVDPGPDGPFPVGEIDVDADDTGIIFWRPEVE